MEIPFLEMRISMVDHVALRAESFAAHVAHVFPYVVVAPQMRRQILFIFETFLAHRTLGRAIIGVILHVIIEIGLFGECLRAMGAPVEWKWQIDALEATN